MKFSIQGKVYDVVDVQKLSMKDMLLFEGQTADFGRAISWGELTRWQRELEQLPDDDSRAQHPEALWVTAVSVWAARRAAGDDVTFEQAVDFPAADIKFLPEPEDHKKPAGKAKPRKAGGAAGKKQLVETTSEPK